MKKEVRESKPLGNREITIGQYPIATMKECAR